jgi:hypothetical protein
MNEYEPDHEREARREKNEVIDRLRAELAAAQERVRELAESDPAQRDWIALHHEYRFKLEAREDTIAERDARIAELTSACEAAALVVGRAVTRAETAERERCAAEDIVHWWLVAP